MEDAVKDHLLWWVIPGTLAGMAMPFVHLDRRMNQGGSLSAYNDELADLSRAGIRAVVSLLNIPSDAVVYESAGFAYLSLPIPDGEAPSKDQAEQFIRFVDRQLSEQHPVAVHCEAGLGRTGTMLAVYLISQGESAGKAIQRIRSIQRAAIETLQQVQFLQNFATP